MLDKDWTEPTDLADSLTWSTIEKRFDEFDALLTSPPCTTFSKARKKNPGPLRTEAAPGIYGRDNLTPAQKERVKTDTLLALRGAAAVRMCEQRSIP